MMLSTRAQWMLVATVTVALTLGAARCAPPPSTKTKRQDVLLTPGGAIADSVPTLPGGVSPEKPYEWQKRPTGSPPACGRKEVLVKGACYRRAHPDDYAPPCEAPTVEWNGACLYAIHKATREPSSVGR